SLDGPYDNFFGSTKRIRKLLMDFIAKTRDVEQTPAEPVFEELPSGLRCAVSKYASQTNSVSVVLHSDGDGWAWSIVDQLRRLTEAAIATKAGKLRNVPPPWVLLLLDCHHLGGVKDYQRLRQAMAPALAARNATARVFHSIYLIQATGDVLPLHSSVPASPPMP